MLGRKRGSGSSRSRSKGSTAGDSSSVDAQWQPSSDGDALSTSGLSTLAQAPLRSASSANSSYRSDNSANHNSEHVDFDIDRPPTSSIDTSSTRSRMRTTIVNEDDIDLSALSDYDLTELFETLQAQTSSSLSAKFWTKVDLAAQKIIDDRNIAMAELFLQCPRLPSSHCLALLTNFPELANSMQDNTLNVVISESARRAIDYNARVDETIRTNDSKAVVTMIQDGNLCEENKLKLLVNFPQVAKSLLSQTIDRYLQALCEFALLKDEYDTLIVESVRQSKDMTTAEQLIRYAPLRHELMVKLLDGFPQLAKTLSKDPLISTTLKNIAKSRLARQSFLASFGGGSSKTEQLVRPTLDYTHHYLLAQMTNDELLVKLIIKHRYAGLAKQLIATRERLSAELKYVLYKNFEQEVKDAVADLSDINEYANRLNRASVEVIYPDGKRFAEYQDDDYFSQMCDDDRLTLESSGVNVSQSNSATKSESELLSNFDLEKAQELREAIESDVAGSRKSEHKWTVETEGNITVDTQEKAAEVNPEPPVTSTCGKQDRDLWVDHPAAYKPITDTTA